MSEGSWYGYFDYESDPDNKDNREVVERKDRPLLYDHQGKPLTNKRPLGFGGVR